MIALPPETPLAVAAPAAPAKTSGQPLSAPEWVIKPTAADVLAVYPAQAKAQGIGGTGELACVAGADQTLSDCYLIRDEPLGSGFDKAALALVPKLRIQPPKRGQDAVPTRIDFPIRFDPPAPAVGEIPAAPRLTWSQAPTPEEVAAVYPKAARESGAAGIGVMRCTIRSGALTACAAATADAQGFSRAATRLAAKFQVGATFSSGRSTEGLILNVPVRFIPQGQRTAAAVTPDWIQQPSKEQVAASFPAVARVQGLARVQVVQTCSIAPDGGLSGCRLKSEEPVGVGGAQAAARLMDAYRAAPWSSDGASSIGAIVDVPVVLSPAASG